jgi:hypothetical protein
MTKKNQSVGAGPLSHAGAAQRTSSTKTKCHQKENTKQNEFVGIEAAPSELKGLSPLRIARAQIMY